MQTRRIIESSDLEQLAGWFTSLAELEQWSGPFIEYPFTVLSLAKGLKLDSHLSVVLLEEDNLLAFGQCYVRLERLHLARLVVSPEYRGQGLIAKLVDQLITLGFNEFGERAVSLFVMQDNQSAAKAYQKLGFEFASYPEEMPLKRCLYMLRRTSSNSS